MSDFCCVMGGCARCVERDAYLKRCADQQHAELAAMGVSIDELRALKECVRLARRAWRPERWIDRVCEELPPAGLTDGDVLADWYEDRGFRAMRLSANEELTA